MFKKLLICTIAIAPFTAVAEMQNKEIPLSLQEPMGYGSEGYGIDRNNAFSVEEEFIPASNNLGRYAGKIELSNGEKVNCNIRKYSGYDCK